MMKHYASRRFFFFALYGVILHGQVACSFSSVPALPTVLYAFHRVNAERKYDLTFYSQQATKMYMAELKSNDGERLNAGDELDLLRQVTEYRRIQGIERDLAWRDPNKKLPLLSIRGKESGYGIDLDAYEAALNNGYNARELLITSNMGLVHYCANEIFKTQPPSKIGTLSKEDLDQEGAIGISRAIDKYNIGLGGKFSTYAVYWIRAAMLRCIAERGEVVRVPEHVSTAVRKMSAAANKLGLSVDGETIAENMFLTSSSATRKWKDAKIAKVIAEEAGLTDSQLHQAMRVQSRRRAGNVSFEDWMQRGRDLQSDCTPIFDLEESQDYHELKSKLSKFLRPKEMEALSLRYGLQTESRQNTQKKKTYSISSSTRKEHSPKRGKWGEAMSFNEVGTCMSVSAEYGRRLVHNALSKLKKAADEGQIEPALLY